MDNLWKILKSPLTGYIIAAVAIFLFLNQCNRSGVEDENRESLKDFLRDSIEYEYNSKLQREIANKNAIKGGKEQLEVLLSKQIDSTGQLKELVRDYKKIVAAGNVTQETEIDTVFIPFETPVGLDFKKDWSLITEHYKLSGLTTQLGTQINSLSIPNTLSFSIGSKDVGFFKTDYRIEAVNNNPFVKTTGLDAYSLSVPNKRLGLSAYVGFGISENFTISPQIGLGLSYQLIRF